MHAIGSVLVSLATLGYASKQRVRDLHDERTEAEDSESLELLLLALNTRATSRSLPNSLGPRSHTVTAEEFEKMPMEMYEQETYTNEFGDTFAKWDTYKGLDFENDTHPLDQAGAANRENVIKLAKKLRKCPICIVGLGSRRADVAYWVAQDLKFRFTNADKIIRDEFSEWELDGRDVTLDILGNVSQAITQEMQNVIEVITIPWEGISYTEIGRFQTGIVINLEFADGETGKRAKLKCEKDPDLRAQWAASHKEAADFTITVPVGLYGSPRVDADHVIKEILTYIENNPSNASVPLINEQWDDENFYGSR
jgi:hypothetical protein